MITNMEIIKNRMQATGLKPTYQRLKVLEYLQKHMDEHPTVEEIYEALLKEIPTISITTIYNTLNAFLEKGLVSAITITGTEVRYDYHTTHHHHFLCKQCGRIFDIDIQCPIVDKDVIQGHRVEEFHGYLKGICKWCAQRAHNRSKRGTR
jgi:Fe2+ or Zn2+ uptake regulation protein